MVNETSSSFLEIIGVGNVDWNQFLINIVLAVLLIVAGVILGQIVKIILRKAMEKGRVEKTPRYNFLDFLIIVIKWSIYILFLNLAIEQLGIPILTSWLTSVLLVIPALTGSLILIMVGYSIGNYLKKMVLDSKLEEWQPLAYIFFYFIIYIFLIFAFKTALISSDKTFVNYLILIWTVILAVSIAWANAKKR